MAVVPYVLEKYATAKQRELEGLDVYIGMKCVPGVGSDAVGHNGRKETVEVKEEEDGAAQALVVERKL